MTRDASVKIEGERTAGLVVEIDRALRRIATAHAALDADEAHWLRLAEQQKIWPNLGYVHALEYLEDVFGYAPRTATERLRVARELGELPELEDALRCGEISWSVARELTRVATPATIEEWMNDARGRRLRDVEQMVAGRRKGDGPDAPPDPARVRHRVVLELDGESLAIWRQMQQAVEVDDGHRLDDRSFVLALGARILHDECAADVVANTNDTPSPRKPTVRNVQARYMIHVTTCRDCKRGWQDGAGVRVEIDRAVLDRAQCNAIICDDEMGKRPSRTIPAAIERMVLERAQHRCEVPDCRSSKHLTIHHIEFWSHGGTHEPWNLIVLCDGHHRVLHDGHLTITGRAPDALVFKRNGQPLRGRDGHAVPKHATTSSGRATPSSVKRAMNTPDFDDDEPAVLAQAALRQLGFKAPLAARAVELARAHVGANTELATLIKEALRHCG